MKIYGLMMVSNKPQLVFNVNSHILIGQLK